MPLNNNNIPNFGRHRYRPAHRCAAEAKAQKEKEDRRTAARLKIEEHLGKRPSENTSPTVTTKPKKLNPKLELMKMKAKAKGDTSIPQASRMYFSVHFPQSTGKEPTPLYFDKTQSIGRMLDRIAQVGNIPNNNHKLAIDDPKRLRLVGLPDKTKLDTEKRIEHVLTNGAEVMIDWNLTV
ncbi:hypothetical protein Unana1_05360 [Umbelopsis nana]